MKVEDDLGLYAHTNHQSELWHFLGVLAKWGHYEHGKPFGDVETFTGDNSERIKVSEC
jgi:hypothetical protein